MKSVLFICCLTTVSATSVVASRQYFYYTAPKVEPVQLSGVLKHDAVRLFLAWVLEDRPLPGSSKRYPGAEYIGRVRKVNLACSFVPGHVALTNDRRLGRCELRELPFVFGDNRLGGVSIFIGLCRDEPQRVILATWVAERWPFGYMSVCTFTETDGRIKARVKTKRRRAY